MTRCELCISIVLIVLKSISVLSHKDGSLIFVIDNTSSMANEVKQLQDGFKSIIDVIITNSSQIQNVVLMTFNDPDWVCPGDKKSVNKKSHLVGKSINRKVLKSAMKSITTYGGGDGPEYSLTGIWDALRNSDSNSYMFVFTDASPKDYKLKEYVIRMAQEKGTQIFFVLTPNCNEDEKALDPYYDIATATFGNVFRLKQESEIQQIISYVREMSSGERTILLAKYVPGGRIDNATFTVDEKIEHIVILASGDNVSLSENLGIKITWLSNVKAIKLKNPAHGDYNITIGGRIMTSVLVYGITNFTFQYSFIDRDHKPESLNKSYVIGTERYLNILAKNGQNIELESVQITNSNSNLIRELQLTKMDKSNSYTTEFFMPSNSTCLIAIKGKLIATGTPIIRIARTPTYPRIDPINQSSQAISAIETSSVTIKCRILDNIPNPNVTWKFRSLNKAEEERPWSAAENSITNITIKNVSESNEGIYTCIAGNKFGFAVDTVNLTVTVVPKIEKSIHYDNITGDKISGNKIKCRILKGKPTPKIKWFKKTRAKVYENYELSSENKEEITVKETGYYKCNASNIVGEDEKIIEVVPTDQSS